MLLELKTIFKKEELLKTGGTPSFLQAIIILLLNIVLLLTAGRYMQEHFLLTGVAMTQVMFLLVTVLATVLARNDMKETFSLRLPRVRHVIGAIFMEIGLFFVVTDLSLILSQIWPEDADAVSQTFEYLLKDFNFGTALLIIAVMPAVCEEILFRGYLFSACNHRFHPVVAMLITGAVFGAYHMSILKFFTTGILGFAFCYVVYMSGSIATSMLMHFLNNAVSVVAMFYSTSLLNETSEVSASQSVDLASMTSSIVLMLIIGVVFIIIGVLCIGRKRNY